MAQRRSPHRPPSNTPLARRSSSTRRLPSSRKRALALVNRLHRSTSSSHAFSASTPPSSSDTPRQVLVPLHPNLRRLPSRLLLAQKESMRDGGHHIGVPVGSKRKRVLSSNENAHSGGRPTRGSGRLKRQRSLSKQAFTSDDDVGSAMDVDDTPTPWADSDGSNDEENEEDSTDDHLINEAPRRQLLRLRKDELVELYATAGLTDDAEALTKHEIVDAIIAARDDVAELPPSSPPGQGDGNSSEYSSDDGNVAGGEETDFGGGKSRPGLAALRRRATVHDLGRINGRPPQNRSASMGHLQTSLSRSLKINGEVHSSGSYGASRRKLNGSSRSPTASSHAHALPSPPATRLRSRKLSTENSVGPNKPKGKGKQVEFNDEVQVNTPRRPAPQMEESDLTDLTELDREFAPATGPSPRRLRSKGQKENGAGLGLGKRGRKLTFDPVDEAEELGRRVTPARKAKGKAVSLKEVEDDEVEEEVEVDELGAEEGDEEVDELASSADATPPPLRRTPVKRRLRPRKMQTFTPPSDGDDEGEEDEEQAEEGDDEQDDEQEDEAEESLDGDEEEETIVVEPRRLRNGKIVGEDDIEEDIGVDDDDDEDEEEACEENSVQDAEEDIDIDAEGETEDSEDNEEVMDDDVDLTVATAKTLVRLRRDDLVKLCETRDLDTAGTKPQLAEALLEWRNHHSTEFSSPSSAGTVRPPSTSKPRRRGSQPSSGTPPVLMRDREDRFHTDEPRTPPLKDAEPELELDLESLGLEDREIPPEKLTKLEKIGSGGFKDVFIGKFRGRKIAISEFRGQLSAMDIKELKLLGGFDHPNIVRFLGVSIPENTRETPVMIVSELCSNGDLFDYVRNVPPPPLHKVLCMMLDIARGLEYLHLRKPSVIHRDCKSSNILITAKGTAKIADFGLAKVKQSTRSMVRSLVGTVNWQAPELWHAHPKYNHKVDVFSCAMVYWEMLQWHITNKKFPWEGMNEHAIYEIVGAKRQRPSLSGLRKQWCPEIVDLIERMWAHDHQDRPTMSEVVEELEQLAPAYR